MDKKDILVVEHIDDRIRFFIERFGHHQLDVIENTKDAIKYLSDNLYDYIFLGGNLGKDNGSCSDLAEFLADNSDNFNWNSSIIIHTWDFVEVDKMMSLLPQAKYLPYNEQELSTLNI